jgi:hypothetical protein
MMGALTTVGQSKKDTVLPKVDSLKAVIVRPKELRPRLKGDTTEYNTEGIRLHQYANVEELLWRLPGLQIDRNGTVTYNGEKIERLLVDGEDIFGGDPASITRNLDASKIAKIQVLDRKSEKAVFTGIDDGQRTKTLNLVLKEDARNSSSGKAEAGGNANGYYNIKGFLTSFRGKEQLAILGFAANTGELGFNNGSGNSGSSVFFSNGTTDPLGASAGLGVPRLTAAAIHYANTWGETADHLSANYQFGDYFSRPVTAIRTIQTQPDSVYRQSQQTASVNKQIQHGFDGAYDWNPTARSSFRFHLRETNSSGTNNFSSSGTSTFNDTVVNSSARTIRDNVSQFSISGSTFWKTQIGKRPERVIAASAFFSKTDNTTEGYLYAVNHYFRPDGSLNSADTADQRKEITSHAINAGGGLNFAQPLWKGALIGLGYGLSFSGNDPFQGTLDKIEGKYEQPIDSLTSRLKSQVINQAASVNLQGKTGKLTYNLTNNWVDYRYRQKDLTAGSSLNLHYLNWTPGVRLNYMSGPVTSLAFNYNVFAQQPSTSQLQPIRNNNDPLHIMLGNPDLRPSLSRNLFLEFHRMKAWMMNLSLYLTLTDNAISTKTITDTLGRQISQPVNVDGSRNLRFNYSLNKKILGLDAGFMGYGIYSRSVSYVNADLSNNDTYYAAGKMSLNKYVQDKYSLQVGTGLSYFYQVSSVNTSAPVHYWIQNHSLALTVYLLRNFEINSNADYTWQQKASEFAPNTSVMLWNAFVGRSFFQNKLSVRAQLSNILDANAGVSRGTMGNVITERSTNILGRNFMLTAIWHFDKNFKRNSTALK